MMSPTSLVKGLELQTTHPLWPMGGKCILFLYIHITCGLYPSISALGMTE